ncbi:copper-binding protein [Rhizobium sp. TRM95111]|uniref:copper-binding protein n=1 Tax=Rhizobium alarense TaxID=2846851 RepID=UPI001F1984BB|nr:copper-binding protein [Rhizobium alarense]MCF3643151.1 copper-binding protein [Rhizobium alarense]
MKSIIKFAAAATLAVALASGAFAAEFTKGTVKKVDAKAKKVTLIHEELKSLEMPAMTMVFRVKDDALLEKLKEGASIEFVAERVEGKLTVTEVK